MEKMLAKYNKYLDDKKSQTTNKIKYVKSYVEKWLIVMSLRKDIKDINFVDCMCNAGIYKDGDFCTSIEVLKLFNVFAINNPDKNYCLFLNDKDLQRTEIIKEVISKVIKQERKNLKLYINVDDVNEYIKKLISNNDKFIYPNATLLFVDPYDFGTVHIPTLKRFCEKYYCELLFNLFTSDWIRNRNNELDKRIEKIIDNPTVKINDKQELINYIISQLLVGKMKYSFNYEFHIETNVELYQIIFFTPNKKGLEVLKDCLWDVFSGKAYYRNPSKNLSNNMQISLFTEEDDKQFIIKQNASIAKDLLINCSKKNHVSFEEIELLILSNTMLKESHLVEHLIKPLISQGIIVKLNENVRKSNYKNDFYNIVGKNR